MAETRNSGLNSDFNSGSKTLTDVWVDFHWREVRTELVCLIALFIGGGCIYFWELFLTWDASYQFTSILQHHRYEAVVDRGIMILFQTPTLQALKAGFSDLDGLLRIYGLPYSFYPFVAGLAIFWILRRDDHRRLILLAGLVMALMPYYYHPLSEQTIAHVLFFVILATNTRIADSIGFHRTFWALGSLAFNVLLFYTHPIASFLFLLEAAQILTLVDARSVGRTVGRRLAFTLPFVAAFFLRWHMMMQHEVEKVSIGYFLGGGTLADAFLSTIDGPIFLLALVATITVQFVAIYLAPHSSTFRSTALWVGAAAIAAIPSFVWPTLQGDSLGWVQKLRIFAAVSTLPFVLAYFVRSQRSWSVAAKSVLMVNAVVLASFLFYAGTLRNQEIKSMRVLWDQRRAPCMDTQSFFSGQSSSLNHWASYFEFILSQRMRRIDQLVVLSPLRCEDAVTTEGFSTLQRGVVIMASEGYFDFSTLQELKRE